MESGMKHVKLSIVLATMYFFIASKKVQTKMTHKFEKKNPLCIFSLISIFSLILSGKEFFHGLH